MLPDARMINNRGGWSRDTRRTQMFTFTEAERYERIIEMEGRRVIIHYGRISSQFRTITARLVAVAYPLDTTKTDPPSLLILRDEDGCWVTLKSSQIRTIEVLDG